MQSGHLYYNVITVLSKTWSSVCRGDEGCCFRNLWSFYEYEYELSNPDHMLWNVIFETNFIPRTYLQSGTSKTRVLKRKRWFEMQKIVPFLRFALLSDLKVFTFLPTETQPK